MSKIHNPGNAKELLLQIHFMVVSGRGDVKQQSEPSRYHSVYYGLARQINSIAVIAAGIDFIGGHIIGLGRAHNTWLRIAFRHGQQA